MQNDTNPYEVPQTSSQEDAPRLRRSQWLIRFCVLAFGGPPISTAAAIVGLVSIGIQLSGLLAAILIPYDSQGAVGKGLAAYFTQLAAIPAALAGVLLSIGGRWWLRRFDNRLMVGLLTSLAALIPLALIYAMIAAGTLF